MRIKNKKYQVKIYGSTGNDASFIETINPKELESEINFRSRINGGQGQLVLKLNRPFTDFGEGVSIKMLNIVKVFQFDEDNKEPRLIYTGFISKYNPFINGSDEGVDVVCLGIASLLNFSYFKDGASFDVTKTNQDPAQIIEDIINHYNSVQTFQIGDDVQSVLTNVTYTFENLLHLQAINKTLELAGGDRYWFVNETGTLEFKEKPSTSTHTFTIAKDIDILSVDKSSESVINSVTIEHSGGTSPDSGSDATSIANYGTKEKFVRDTSISDQTTATQRINQILNDNNDLKVETSLRINTEYDIETIKPGDTMQIRNIDKDQTLIADNIQIVSVEYTPDYANIELESIESSFGVQLSKFITNS